MPLVHYLTFPIPRLPASTRRGLSSETSFPPTSQHRTVSCAPRTAPSPCLMPLVHHLPFLKTSAREGLSSDGSFPPTSQRRTASCAPRTAPSPCLIPLVHYLPLLPPLAAGAPSTRRGRLRDGSLPPTSQRSMAS